MKYEKILLGNGVEFLTGTQMKGTRGGDGYGYGYGSGDEYCLICELSGTPMRRYTWLQGMEECFDFGEANCIGGSFLCGNCDYLRKLEGWY